MSRNYKYLFNAICSLSYSNRSIGLWDNNRFKECQKGLKKISLDFLYSSEKNTRKHLEKRADAKNKIDYYFYLISK